MNAWQLLVSGLEMVALGTILFAIGLIAWDAWMTRRERNKQPNESESVNRSWRDL